MDDPVRLSVLFIPVVPMGLSILSRGPARRDAWTRGMEDEVVRCHEWRYLQWRGRNGTRGTVTVIFIVAMTGMFFLFILYLFFGFGSIDYSRIFNCFVFPHQCP